MIGRLIVAGAIGVLTFLLVLLLGYILVALNVPVLETAGKFFKEWAAVFGVIAAVLAFFTGANPFGGRV